MVVDAAMKVAQSLIKNLDHLMVLHIYNAKTDTLDHGKGNSPRVKTPGVVSSIPRSPKLK